MPLNGNKSVLRFRLHAESHHLIRSVQSGPWALRNYRNSSTWMGKEPGSCMIIHIEPEHLAAFDPPVLNHVEAIIEVGYRPRGWISTDEDGTRRDGWARDLGDKTFDEYPLADFNAVEFGDLIREEN